MQNFSKIHCSILHFHQQCMIVPAALHPLPTLVNFSHFNGNKWKQVTFWYSIPFHVLISQFEFCFSEVSESMAHVVGGRGYWSFYCCGLFFCILEMFFIRYVFSKYFLSVGSLSFHFLKSVFRREDFNLDVNAVRSWAGSDFFVDLVLMGNPQTSNSSGGGLKPPCSECEGCNAGACFAMFLLHPQL